MNNVLILLTPCGNYFFGGERTFGEKEDSKKANYSASSNFFPQQTTLLGALRYEILRRNDLLAPNHKTEPAINLVGNTGFTTDASNNRKINNYGTIMEISPVFIVNREDINSSTENMHDHFYYPLSINRQLTGIDKLISKEFLPEAESMKTWSNNANSKNYPVKSFFKTYDPKKNILVQFSNNKGKYINSNELFKKVFQVGINKSITGQTNDDGFYKQDFIRMKSGYAFAFIATLNAEFKNDQSIIPMGADGSAFLFESVAMDINPFKETSRIQNALSEESKITFLSDTYIDASVFNHLSSVINLTSNFSHIITPGESKLLYSLHREINEDKPYKSNNLLLITKGSAFFCQSQELDNVKELIDRQKTFKQIGFNYYTIS